MWRNWSYTGKQLWFIICKTIATNRIRRTPVSHGALHDDTILDVYVTSAQDSASYGNALLFL